MSEGATDTQPFWDSRAQIADPEALRERMQTDGYLFFSGLLPQAITSEVYAAILALCRAQGWADADNRALGPPRLEGSEAWWQVYDPLQRLEGFHALAQRPELTGIIAAITGEAVLVHPRNIARITFPGAEHFTTPPHQDFPLIQGTPETYTAWMPLCDCPSELGGLRVLAGSHRAGQLPVKPASGPGGMTVISEQPGLAWHMQELSTGDVLFFHSLTVHAARPNLSENRLRISVDYRYQGVSQPVVADSLEPHFGRQTWEQIYRGWQNPALPFYWRELPLNIVARGTAQ